MEIQKTSFGEVELAFSDDIGPPGQNNKVQTKRPYLLKTNVVVEPVGLENMIATGQIPDCGIVLSIALMIEH